MLIKTSRLVIGRGRVVMVKRRKRRRRSEGSKLDEKGIKEGLIQIKDIFKLTSNGKGTKHTPYTV